MHSAQQLPNTLLHVHMLAQMGYEDVRTTRISSAALHASATAAFASLLVHYKATHRVLHMSDDAVIQAAGDLLLGCGLTDQPVITKRLAIMLGLERHPMIKCATRLGEDMEDDDEKSVTSEKRRSWRG